MIDYGLGVVLDVLTEKDVDITRECRNDPNIRDWCRQVGLISARQHARWWERKDDDNTIEMFAIRRKSESLEFLGVCGLTSIDYVARRAEFSLYIRTTEKNKGYGKIALISLLKFGFLSLNMNRIWGECFEGNPSLKMFLELGFKEEGIRKDFYFKNGSYINAHLISINRRAFESNLPVV